MIYLIRHGETDWNLFKRFNGCTETFLNQTGIMQAQKQADKLKNIVFDVCFCSPQKRSIQACKIIHGGTIRIDERLAEIDCGDFEGTEENEESFKMIWEAIKTGENGTETYMHFMNRNCDFCDMLANEYKGKNVLIVTHAGNARVIDYFFKGKPNDYDMFKSVAHNREILTYDNSNI